MTTHSFDSLAFSDRVRELLRQSRDAVSERAQRVLLSRYLTQGGVKIGETVTQAATTKAVTFTINEPNTSFGVLVTPNWLTTWRVTTKATTGFTVDFGTAAPASATFDWVVFREE